MANGASLTCDAAPFDLNHCVEASFSAGDAIRGKHLGLRHRTAKVLLVGTTIDDDLALTRNKSDASD
jgi:hypothetical protein